MRDGIHVVPHDHLAGWQARRIRREGLRAVDGDDVDRDNAGIANRRRGRVPAVSAGIAVSTAAPHTEAQRDDGTGCYEYTHLTSPFCVFALRVSTHTDQACRGNIPPEVSARLE